MVGKLNNDGVTFQITEFQCWLRSNLYIQYVSLQEEICSVLVSIKVKECLFVFLCSSYVNDLIAGANLKALMSSHQCSTNYCLLVFGLFLVSVLLSHTNSIRYFFSIQFIWIHPERCGPRPKSQQSGQGCSSI